VLDCPRDLEAGSLCDGPTRSHIQTGGY